MNPNQEQFGKVVNLADYQKRNKEIRQQKMRDTPNHPRFYKRKANIEENLNSIDKERNEN